MRKILLATTALVGFAVAGAAQAATAPLSVTVGGDIEFVAGAFHEAEMATDGADPAGADFETLYSLNFGVAGKAANGIEYGGALVLDNKPSAINGYVPSSGDALAVSQASIFMSGAYGKVQMGDARGALDLAVTAPSVGGARYLDFLNTSTSFAKDLVAGIDDGTDYSTNVTYYTPKVGNDMGKVQAAVTYVPKKASVGSHVVLDQTDAYKNLIKGAIAYNGNIKSVAVNASVDVINGTTQADPANTLQDFTAWGVGLAGAYQGFTLGATYADNGDYNHTVLGQKDQRIITAGLKYEFDKYKVGFDYLNGEGQSLAVFANDRVKSLDVYNFGGAYTWASGLTTTANVVFFDQDVNTANTDNKGYVLLVSQKLAF
jgi:outer membrane protein OmpU